MGVTTDVFGINYFREVIFKLLELVETSISNEMSSTRGALMYDSWTNSRMHYLGMFVTYIKDLTIVSNRREVKRKALRTPLLSVSTIASLENASDSEAFEFTAHNHIEQFRDIFNLHNIDMNSWVLCTMPDNFNVNLFIAKGMKVPHIGCANHKLNLQVNKIVKYGSSFRLLLESVRKTFRTYRAGLKTSAMLRYLNVLKPTIDNPTRWSRKYHMIKRFSRLRSDLVIVADTDDVCLNMDRTARFKNRSIQYERIDSVTVLLQKKDIILSECRLPLDLLIDTIRKEVDDMKSPVYKCNLGDSYIKQNAAIVPNPSYESGVCKIQKRSSGNFGQGEKCV